MAFDLFMQTGECRVKRDSVENVDVRTDMLVVYNLTYRLCAAHVRTVYHVKTAPS